MAGSNVGTLNSLLEPYHIAFGDKRVLTGDFIIDKRQIVIDSGTEIVKFPKDGFLISAELQEEELSLEARDMKNMTSLRALPSLGTNMI
jgi:hypothetical protein